jgi:hypothetical protein
MIGSLYAKLTPDERKCLDVDEPSHWALWAYHEDCIFDMQWDSIPFQHTCYLPQMLQYVTDPACVKHDVIFQALFELTREVYRDRYEPDVVLLAQSIQHLTADGRLGEWLQYARNFHRFYLHAGPISEAEAFQLCLTLLFPLPEYNWEGYRENYQLYFTGRIHDQRHEIKFFRNYPPGGEIMPEFVYVNLNQLDWCYRFFRPL